MDNATLTQTPGTLACYRGRIQEPRIEDAAKVALRVSTFLGILFATRNFKLTPSEADPIHPSPRSTQALADHNVPKQTQAVRVIAHSNIQVRTRRYLSSTLYLITIAISSVPDIPPVSSSSSNLCRCRCCSRGLPPGQVLFHIHRPYPFTHSPLPLMFRTDLVCFRATSSSWCVEPFRVGRSYYLLVELTVVVIVNEIPVSAVYTVRS